ncbi:tRNA 2-thiouridine(34) synthase MnmA [Thiorhodovibrio frisius]|uniref:tRNA-specific 2-thiouridylase MnmA n=1 Tax=Thiorhodovibrio frisius TaxID=631362 RepID=H8Z047_9GAMM|nr:tRNA 2-thiouridine(34) synthase MnmA [Thiorhodovibrio frisius]EIC21220.1 tRNA (5-methylaminomethyl-2-thiouridylate)-methyltransferase [Thiorhodovibrio frisius]WPL23796.1 tRNA-specific 2-thiouridylase MnmA [Thiorhodovibrio frisius]
MSASQRVLVGLSGGVDSAVATHLLIEQGYQVEALFMKNWEEDDAPGYCAAAEDLADAQAVTERLGIPLRTVNFATEYWDRVFEQFLAEYRALRTPNPDILCNSEIKFRAFLDHALTLGADWIATGHYARVMHQADRASLYLARDANKDQTYFLHRLDREQLGRVLFPLADLTKPEIRAMAESLGLANASKKDSTGICFIGERRFADFLARYLPREPGPIETPEGQVLGEHQGLAYYTIGQRQGLGIGGQAGAAEAPWFVAAKDPAKNVLIVVQGGNHPLLFAEGLSGEQLHWISGAPPAPAPFDCLCRLRHRQPLQACTLVEYHKGHCQVHFATPQRAVTPGQSAVFYYGDRCLGGCIITSAI